MRKEKPESEKIENKSRFTGSVLEWLRLVKTVVALANTEGGELRPYNTAAVDHGEFDSAKIDDRVNSYVEPRIQNIKTLILKSYVKIVAESSPSKPHVFKKDGPYQDPGNPSRQRNAFYRGQVLVRHSSKNEPATKDDYDRMFKEKHDEFMKRISLVSQLPMDKPVRIEEGPDALPIKIVEGGDGLPALLKEERINPEKDYPYFTTDLAEELDKSVSFIAKAAALLSLKGNEKFHMEFKSSRSGTAHKYSKEALRYLRKFLKENPKYNPYRAGKRVATKRC